MNKNSKIAIAVIVPLAAIVTIILLGTLVSTTSQINNCAAWSDEIELKRQQFWARAESLSGILNIDGQIESEQIALNAEINDFNSQCT